MKSRILFALAVLTIVSCTKTGTTTTPQTNTVVTTDSSEFNGRLKVSTYDYTSGTALYGSDLYLYINYDDIKRNLVLLYVKTGSSSVEADFGYLLQGNYYIRAQNGFKSDTALVQVLNKRVNNKSVYLK